jgi:hypothetical protein
VLGVLILLLSVKLRTIRGALASLWAGNRLKVIAGLVTVGVIAPAMFFLFRYLFMQLASLPDPDFGLALAARLLSSAFLAFTVFLAISALISGISTLFRSSETALLLSMPFRSAPVALFRTFESWFYAGWSTVLLGVPVILAFASVTGKTLSTTFAGVFTLIPLVVVSAAAGTIVMSLLSRLGGMNGLRRGAGATVVLAAAGLLLFFQGLAPGTFVIEDESGTSLAAVQRFVASLPSAGGFPWPSTLLSSVLASSATREGLAGPARYAALLWGEALLVCMVALLLVCPGFRRRFSAVSADSSRQARPHLMFRRGGALRAIIEKDVLLFFRDPIQLSQLGLLAGLFILYVASLSRYPLEFAQRLWLGVAVFMNISFSGFVMATLLVRFGYPAISLEGPGLLFLLQLPRARNLLLKSKWFSALIGVLPLMLVTGIYSTRQFGGGSLLLAESAGTTILLAFALVSINVSLGAIFPRFGDNSAASIASGQGGIIAAFASMGFVLAVVSGLSMATRAYLEEGFREQAMAGPISVLAAILIPLTAVVSIGSMAAARRSLAGRDF